jgi:hypothetical protein
LCGPLHSISDSSAGDQPADGLELQVNNQSIAIPADYRAAGIPNSNTFFNNSAYRANNAACQAAGPS